MNEPQKLLCCRIDQATDIRCATEAEYEIVAIAAVVHPYDYTHACTMHVGDLLGSVDGLAEQWSVYQLAPTTAPS